MFFKTFLTNLRNEDKFPIVKKNKYLSFSLAFFITVIASRVTKNKILESTVVTVVAKAPKLIVEGSS